MTAPKTTLAQRIQERYAGGGEFAAEGMAPVGSEHFDIGQTVISGTDAPPPSKPGAAPSATPGVK